MNTIQPTMNHPHNISTTLNRHFPVARAYNDPLANAFPPLKGSNPATRLVKSLSHILTRQIDSLQTQKNLSQSNLSSILETKSNTPTSSPKENISENWREIHGMNNWDTLLDPLNPSLRRELIKYGEFAQATYDAFDFDHYSEYCGSCRFNRNKLFEKLDLVRHGYDVTKYIYAMSQIDFPTWLEKSELGETWSTHSNWMGFVCVSNNEETQRIGRRDIVISWRGTVSISEWFEDFQSDLESFGHGDRAKVEQGFLSIYTSKCDSSRYNKSSASEQVMHEVAKLVHFYKRRGEEVSISITGHSLGGALALLSAHEIATNFPNMPISVISFGSPRVGNLGFRHELEELGVNILRVITKQDIVPWMPGTVFNESLQNFDELTKAMEWVYLHVGAELKLDARSSPYLKKGLQFLGYHLQETYLHLLDGFESPSKPFRKNAKRDIALVNKECDLLVNELRIPPKWYQVANKGLVQNDHGRWVKPIREPEDVPSHAEETYNNNSQNESNLRIVRAECDKTNLLFVEADYSRP